MPQPLMRVVARRCGQGVARIPGVAPANSISIAQRKLLHSSKQASSPAAAAAAATSSKVPPEPRENPAVGLGPSRDEPIGHKRLADFDLEGRVFIVTGGARGLGLCLAEGLVEAGGNVYCFDREAEPSQDWDEAATRAKQYGGSLHYCQQDVSDTKHLDQTIASIADRHQRLDGLIAAAGVQKICPAVEYTADDVAQMMAINYTGVMMTATATARQMFRYKCHGSMCLIASMSGQVANKGLISPVYNSSKAAVIQLARNLAMEWSPIRKDGTGGIRVNCISPGHILTPMVLKNFEEVPGLRARWESENMMGRLAETTEFKGAALFLLSKASSFMTGSNIVIDGGHTSW
ncbi:short-chain dehydrogenase [Xylaria bambusicola]|uniref:short-chain dehydrogenase n=1 Tax=Xylaria bambusicola TaxID=326684 RepID=UPI00200722E4|nr:short-chain dehydrogenase [Xylaria bambusicola]KAI0527940.1 short-chain dehydrogenase [Xylaria bambusicola]